MTLDTNVLISYIKCVRQNRRSSSLPVRYKPVSDSLSILRVTKSTAQALIFKENGKKFYEEKKLQEALVSYTGCVATALPDSDELRIAYGNRSAALFESKEYVACLLDINRALKCPCSDLVFKEKLLNRKGRCLAQIKSSVEANGTSEIGEDETNPVDNIDREPSWRAEMLSKFGNRYLPNTSPKIKLKYNSEWGRHFVATEDIKPGETLISEEFFVAVTSFSNKSRFTYCDFCLTECHALIPCPTCALVLYCSEQCLTKAYGQYHRMECQLILSLPSFYSTSFDNAIPIRLFLVGTEQGAALKNLRNRLLRISDIFEENYNFADKDFIGDYVTALRLTVGGFDPMYLKSRVEDAVEVVTQLRKLAFFQSVPDDRLEEAEVFATALLLNNSKTRHMNRISSVADVNKLVEDSDSEGLVLLQCMMNHSCYPNVSIFQRKRENIMFSVRPIKKNEQLFCSYFKTFAHCPKPQRVRYLDFVCQCEACTENWPTFSDYGISEMLNDELIIKIIDDLLPGVEQGHMPLFDELMNISAPLMDDTELKKLEIGEIIPIVAEMVSVLYKLMKRMSFTLMTFRYYVITFVEFFYEELERDLRRNEGLNLPFPEVVRDSNDLCTSQQPLSIDEYRIAKATYRIFNVIARLNYYMDHGHFVNKNFVG